MATFKVNSPIDFSALQNEINKPKAPGAVINASIPSAQSITDIYGGTGNAHTTPFLGDSTSNQAAYINPVTKQSQYTGTLPFTGTQAPASNPTVKKPVDTFNNNADANYVAPGSVAGITKTPTGTPIYDGVSSTPVGYRDAYGNMTSTATPGSVAALPQVTGSNIQSEIDAHYANQKLIANTPVDENALYTQELARRQQEIDAINAMYADRINQARIRGQSRIGSQTAASARGGLLGSNIGEAMTNRQIEANVEEQNAIDNERKVAVSAIKREIAKDAKDRAEAKTLAASKSATDLVEQLKENRKIEIANQSKRIASLVAAGEDYDKMTQAEKDEWKSQLKMNDAELAAEFATQKKLKDKEDKETQKLDEEIANKKADTAKVLADTANWGKLTEYQKGQLALDNIKNERDYELAKEKSVSDRAKTKSEIDVLVNTSVAGAQADGQWDNWSKDERNRFIRALGGLPSEYEI